MTQLVRPRLCCLLSLSTLVDDVVGQTQTVLFAVTAVLVDDAGGSDTDCVVFCHWQHKPMALSVRPRLRRLLSPTTQADDVMGHTQTVSFAVTDNTG